MTEHDAPSPEDSLAVARRDLSEAHADLQQVQSVVLREGPRSKKTARYVAVRNRHTGEVHHHALTLETGKKIKGSWELDDKRSISFADEDDDEIARLMEFLRRVHPTGEVAAAGPGFSPAQLTSLGEAGLRELVKAVREAPEAFKAVSAAIAFGRHAHGVERLKKLVAAEAAPSELLAVLREHPWLVASAHGTPVEAEALGDVVLQRSPAGRLEAILVGEPTSEPLVEGEAPSAVLGRRLGEAMRVRELLAPAGEVALTLLLGKRVDEAEQMALQRLNANLKGLEVLTYVQALQRGQRVLDVLRATAKGEEA